MASKELAPFAALPDESKGRVYKEEQSYYRNEFQRDRDRIILKSLLTMKGTCFVHD